jgi:hypothetical protein
VPDEVAAVGRHSFSRQPRAGRVLLPIARSRMTPTPLPCYSVPHRLRRRHTTCCCLYRLALHLPGEALLQYLCYGTGSLLSFCFQKKIAGSQGRDRWIPIDGVLLTLVTHLMAMKHLVLIYVGRRIKRVPWANTMVKDFLSMPSCLSVLLLFYNILGILVSARK